MLNVALGYGDLARNGFDLLEGESKTKEARQDMIRWLNVVCAMNDITTQEQLAAIIGRKRQAVGQYRTGDRDIPEDVVRILLDRFPDAPPPPSLVVSERRKPYDEPDQAKIPLYNPNESAEVALWQGSKETTPVPWKASRGAAFAITIADHDMAPRFLPGERIICRRLSLFEDGRYVIAAHHGHMVKQRTGPSRPRLYVRWYSFVSGKLLLAPRNPSVEAFEAKDLELLGVVVGRQVVYSEEPEDYDLEYRSTGLLYDPRKPIRS